MYSVVLVPASQQSESAVYAHRATLGFSRIGHYRVLSRTIQPLLTVTCFVSILCVPVSRFIPPSTFPLNNHKFVFNNCESTSVL